MKIAVCISGQPRTILYTVENIKKFFSNHDTDYFCHAWDYNTFKIKNPDRTVNPDPILWEQDMPVNLQEFQEAMSKLNPKKVVMQGKSSLPAFFDWSSLFYSMMMANHYKKMYESENNFRYDFVFRTTYQNIFPVDYPFNPGTDKDNYLDIYGSERGRMKEEFNLINVSDYCFYGSSTVMDLLCDIYKYAHLKARNRRPDDWDTMGPGTMLTGMCAEYNLDFYSGRFFTTTYRKEMIPTDPNLHYDKIREFNETLYV